jgi:hypothetical protein
MLMSRSPVMAAEPCDPVARSRHLSRSRFLRSLLVDQLAAFEGRGLQLRSGRTDVSLEAMEQVRASIGEFDALIAAGPKDRP